MGKERHLRSRRGCDRPGNESATEMNRQSTRREVEKPEEPGLRLADAPCALCGAFECAPRFRKRDRLLVTCSGCGLMRVDPLPGREEVDKLYSPQSGYQTHRLGATTRYTRFESARSDRLAALIGPAPHATARLLDVGCGTGDFLLRARPLGWTVHGVEIGEHLASYACIHRDLPVEHGCAEEVGQLFGAATFDVITLWDVIEHLRQPLDVMRSLCRLLKPGGRLYLATPNLDGWVARFHWQTLARRLGIWPHPEPPRHLYQFSRKTIRQLYHAAGIDTVTFIADEIPLWYTSGFVGEPGAAQWIHGEPGAPGARGIYLFTAPVFLAARLVQQGDSMIVCGSLPSSAGASS